MLAFDLKAATGGSMWEHFKELLAWTVTGLIDAVFLGAWVIVQWLLARFVIDAFPLSGIEAWQLDVLQILFAVGTLAPILVFIVRDIMIMVIRAGKRIRREL